MNRTFNTRTHTNQRAAIHTTIVAVVEPRCGTELGKSIFCAVFGTSLASTRDRAAGASLLAGPEPNNSQNNSAPTLTGVRVAANPQGGTPKSSVASDDVRNTRVNTIRNGSSRNGQSNDAGVGSPAGASSPSEVGSPAGVGVPADSLEDIEPTRLRPESPLKCLTFSKVKGHWYWLFCSS